MAAQALPMDTGRDGRQIGVRVIRRGIWREVLEIDWCRYLRASALGVPGVSSPMLTSHTQRQVFFTDVPSISTCFDAESLAERLTLADVDLFQIEGALLVFFPLFGMDVQPHRIDGVPQPLTEGGGRQWVIPRNVPFSEECMVFEVLPRPRPGHEPEGMRPDSARDRDWEWVLSGWRYANPKLATEAYRDQVLLRARSPGDFVPSDASELDATFRRLGNGGAG